MDWNYECLDVRQEANLLTITLNRPEHLNAVNARMHGELADLWSRLNIVDDIRCIVLTGAGRAFCSGGDVSAMLNGEFGEHPTPNLFANERRLFRGLLGVRQPVIAAVNGDCVGLGASMALLTDYVVMSEHARIGDPHVRVGLVAGDGGVPLWPLLVGMHRAKEALLTGRLYSAQQAYSMGLGNEVVPAGAVVDRALAVAREVAENPPLAVQWTKLALNKVLGEAVEASFDVGLALEMLTFVSEDHKRALEAFLTKTAAEYRGF
ncbi:MAG: enoyl-CoA hydratase/isomerase family protein [Dehalococcoidia bacterium]